MPTNPEQLSRQLQPTDSSGNPTQLVVLYELDLTPKGGTVLYFHAGVDPSGSNTIGFKGHTYSAFPIKAENFEWTTKGTLPRPKLTVSNIGSVTSSLCRQFGDLVGCVLTMRMTFYCYTSGGSEPDNTKEFPPQIYVVDRKVAETNSICSFDLATPMDSEGVLLPRRQILATACPFTYRGVECGYTALSVRDRLGVAFGPSFSNGVITNLLYNGHNIAIILTSATANFQPGDVGKRISGPAFNAGSYITVRNSATQVQFWPPAPATVGSGAVFVVQRVVDRGAWSSGTTYAQYDQAYLLVLGIRVYAVSKAGGNLNHPIYDENFWMLDVCLKKLPDCEDHFLANQPLPYGGWPGANKLQ
jgi:lambda family phage minor tail protein L